MGDILLIDPVFIMKLAKFICYDSATRKHDPAKAKILVEKVGVTVKSMRSWVTGNDCPPPMIKKEIEEFLDSYIEQPEIANTEMKYILK